MLRISWLPTASDDLAQIIAYIAQRSPQAARHLRQRIEDAIRPVAEHPYLYRTGRVPGTREIVAHHNYVLVYQITEEAIEVVTVVHVRQEYPFD